jgi:hypothetical protein
MLCWRPCIDREELCETACREGADDAYGEASAQSLDCRSKCCDARAALS